LAAAKHKEVVITLLFIITVESIVLAGVVGIGWVVGTLVNFIKPIVEPVLLKSRFELAERG
jgi:hypothetical protein